LIAVVLWFLYLVRGILSPFILAALFAYLLSPLVIWLRTRGINRVLAVVLLYLVFFGAIIAATVIVVPVISRELSEFKAHVPVYFEHVKTFLHALQRLVERWLPVAFEQPVIGNAIDGARQFAADSLTRAPRFVFGIFSVFSFGVLVLFLTFLMLLFGGRMITALFEVMPARAVETGLNIVWEIDRVLGNYIRGQIIEALVVAILSVIGYQLLGIKYAIIIGIVAGFANLIPYVGPATGAALAVTIGLIQTGDIVIAPKVALVAAAVQFVDNNLVQPAVMSRGMHLNPLVIVFAFLAGAELYGALGMVLAVPVAAMVQSVVGIIMKFRRVSYESARQ
jgi:predicted PurR-regulated permease PerM